MVCGRDGDRAAETRQAIESAGGRAVALLAGLADPAAVRRLVAEAEAAVAGGSLGTEHRAPARPAE